MTVDEPSDPLGKIRSAALRKAVQTSDRHVATVVVELDIPTAKIGVRGAGSRVGLSRFMLIQPSAPSAEVVEGVRKELKRVLGRAPHRFLTSSNSFVLNANGEQLDAVARIPHVRAIWPNTRRF